MRTPITPPLARLALASFGILALGCASAGTQATGGKDVGTRDRAYSGDVTMRLTHETARYVEVLEAPRETVLAALIQVYQELEIPVAGTDPATGEIGNPSFEPRRIGGQLLSRFLNCGSSGVTGRPNADSYRVTMYLVSRVESTEDGRTRLSTEVDARAQARGVSGYPVQCQSRGTLETRIAEMVEERIG